MKCPIDSSTLQLAQRDGIEIDFCPDCRGVWLDRGELDKIVTRASSEMAPPPRPAQRDARRFDDDFEDDFDNRGEDLEGRRGEKKRRSSFLGDLFDIG